MARTRVDPWQCEPELFWKDTALATIIPSYPSHTASNPLHSKPQPPSILSVNNHVSETRPGYVDKLPTMPLPDFTSIAFQRSPKSKKLSPHNPSVHSSVKSFSHGSPLKLKLKRKRKSSDEFNKAASKVLAALNMTNLNRPPKRYSDFDCQSKPRKRKRLELPDGDKRKNMVPKVVLRDIGHIISMVCPKLKTPLDSPSADRVSTSWLAGEGRYKNENWHRPSILSPKSPAVRGDRSSVITIPDTPELILDPPILFPERPVETFDEPPVVTLDEAPLVTIGTAEVIIGDSSVLSEMSPSNIMNGISLALTNEASAALSSPRKSPPRSEKSLRNEASAALSSPRKPPSRSEKPLRNEALAALSSPRKSPSRSEKSSTPISRTTASFDKLGSVAPSFPKLVQQNSSSTAWPKSSTPGPAYPVESVSSFSTKPRPSPVDHNTTHTSLKKTPPLKSAKSKEVRQSEKAHPELVELELSITKAASPIPPSQPPPAPVEIIEDGFPGFPQEDGKRLKKTRFHVNTNILASSLDILDLHQNSDSTTPGSPSSCINCNIVFSSVRHCKYHQSVMSSDLDPARHHNVQEGDVWLCPWCPLMSFTNEFLNKHKEVCREKGRCQQEPKASSVRKSVPSSSKRRNTLSGSSSISPSSNSYKIVHGFVIPV